MGDPRSAPRAPAPPTELKNPHAPIDTDDPVFGRLRVWRRQEAAERGLPPYVIFHDSTLAAIAEAAPSSLPALRQIPGVGPLKMQRYGEKILAIVAEGAAGAGDAAVAGDADARAAR